MTMQVPLSELETVTYRNQAAQHIQAAHSALYPFSQQGQDCFTPSISSLQSDNSETSLKPGFLSILEQVRTVLTRQQAAIESLAQLSGVHVRSQAFPWFPNQR